jgi:hypothetical protein
MAPLPRTRKKQLSDELSDKQEFVSEKRKARVISYRKLLLAVVVLVLLCWYLITSLISINTWKAVFLDNNQVYFGKFLNIPFTDSITLRNVYYIKAEASASTTMPGGSTGTVISPLSDMVHAPENTMTISRNHILFFENLQRESALVKSLSKR